ncbi:MAG: ABC transporter ATP-binding protein/permease [Oscillospiraceae bacterium]|jgi:ATP-binding cassette subfamily B protein|nr:ABC transporter ATP-binding protein/permease [Oscillospiraceae bacterium]
MEEKKLKGFARVRYIFFLLKPYWKYGKLYMIVTILMAAVFQPLSTYLSTLLPQKAIDAVMQGAPRKDILLTVGGYTLIIALIAVITKSMEDLYTRLMQTKIYNRIRNDVNERALFTDFKYYDNPDFFTKFMFAQEQYPMQSFSAINILPAVIKGVVTIAAMGAVIAMAGPALLGVTLGFVLLSAVIGLPMLKPQTELRVKQTDNWRPLDYITRMLKQKENAAELRSSGAGLKFLNRVNVVIESFSGTYLSFMKKVMPFQLMQDVLAPIQTAVVLLYIILFVIDGDTSKIGLYASLTAASVALVSNLESVWGCVNHLIQSMLYGERIAAFFEAKSEIEPPREGAVAPPQGAYELELRDVSFGYDNAAFGIEHLNLRIPQGQRVAIVGENGAGKTTLTKLLLRLYDVNSGAILINGKNIKEYDVHAFRRHIGVAFQDVRVLAMSLRDNLTAYHEVPDEQLIEIINRLGLDGVFEKAGRDLSKMVSREFTEDGIALSGGEAQRLSLARLFTGEFGLMVLDEPSSALDPLAEHKLMKIIMDASNTATTIMIAHRLSTVRDFDVIYHMEDGRIIEAGTHNELMAARGKYYEMFTRQAENYQHPEEVFSVAGA